MVALSRSKVNWTGRYKALAPFVNWKPGKPPTNYQKRKIRESLAQLQAYKDARQAFVYRPKDPRKLKIAQSYARMKGKGWRVAFIPSTGDGKPEIRISKSGKMSVKWKAENVTRRVHLFHDFEDYPGEVMENPRKVVRDILEYDETSREFGILCGEFETHKAVDREFLAEEVERMFRPSNDEKGGSGATTVWCDGVVGYEFTKQASFTKYRDARNLVESKKTKAKRERQKAKIAKARAKAKADKEAKKAKKGRKQ